jgi:hypothetical protein
MSAAAHRHGGAVRWCGTCADLIASPLPCALHSNLGINGSMTVVASATLHGIRSLSITMICHMLSTVAWKPQQHVHETR